VTVVADAGPLIALAKVDGLPLLFSLFPEILIPPAVRTEAVTVGQRRNEPDAHLLAQRLEAGGLRVVAPAAALVSARLGLGERQSIGLAVERSADWFLADDLEARRLAEETFQSAGVRTGVKGTLGVIVSAYLAGNVTAPDALRLVETIEQRPDIWVSRQLCGQVEALLRSP